MTDMPIATSPQFLTDPDKITDWLNAYCHIFGDYSIADDGRVSVYGDMQLNETARKSLTYFAVQFDSVKGDFYCSRAFQLKSLEGAPRDVYGFYCTDCHNLLSLHGAPLEVFGDFKCYENHPLANLKGAPNVVHGNFDCTNCADALSVEGLQQLNGALILSLDTPTPSGVKQLLLDRRRIKTEGNTKLRKFVNAYSATGDLLAAIAAFEKYFNVPFHDTIVVSNLDTELPGL